MIDVVPLFSSGKVSQGVLALLEDLPVCHVKAKDLSALISNPGRQVIAMIRIGTDGRTTDTDLHKVCISLGLDSCHNTHNETQIYVVHALPGDYLVRGDGQPYDRTHYYANPQAYTSEFHTRVSAKIKVLMSPFQRC